jgi:chromosome segregation ATPase
MSEFPCKEHEAKIAVLEVEVGHLQTDSHDTKEWLKSIDGKLDGVKERLDKQNGAIPHMTSDVAKLSESVSILHENITKIQLNTNKTELRTKILWGTLATVGAAFIAAIVKLLFA